MDSVFKEILQKIQEKTLAGLANWQMSDSSNEFKLEFVAGTVTVGTYYSYDHFYNCKLLNNNGDVIFNETQKKGDAVSDFSLENFYSIAMDSYTNKKQVVSSILKQLDMDGKVGAPDLPLPPSPVDDLPF